MTHCSNFVIIRRLWSVTYGAIKLNTARIKSSIKFHFLSSFKCSSVIDTLSHWDLRRALLSWHCWYSSDHRRYLSSKSLYSCANLWCLSDNSWYRFVNIWQLLRSSLFSLSMEAMESIVVTVIVSMLCLDLCLLCLLASKGLKFSRRFLLHSFLLS